MSIRISKETHKKIVLVRAKIEFKTGKRTTLERALNQALDKFLEELSK